MADLQDALPPIAVPQGFPIGIGGEYVEQQKMFGDLLAGLLIAIFLVYTVMVVQFESLMLGHKDSEKDQSCSVKDVLKR